MLLKFKSRKFICLNCDHIQEIHTNHKGECIDYCKSCSWKPSFGKDIAIPMFGNQAYRRFMYYKKPTLYKRQPIKKQTESQQVKQNGGF